MRRRRSIQLAVAAFVALVAAVPFGVVADGSRRGPEDRWRLAQIYTCTTEDGTRVFSDSRCGPDAKVVPGSKATKRTPAKASATGRPARTRKSAEELELLLELCDAGDVPSCNQWTMGGGPNLLREKERAAELECEGGSLAACEERYCRDGVDKDCRARVQRTARLAGDTWYLREEGSREADGLTRYGVRCIPEGAPSRDVTIACEARAGPNRCSAAVSGKDQQERPAGFSRLDEAAVQLCSK